MESAPALTRTSLSEQIKAHLLSRIMDGTLRPGDRIVELKVAAEMATSQAPVREAIRELEALGIVESLRNKGSRVRTIDEAELRDIYDVRAKLEGYAAELATRKQAPVGKTLRACIKEMRAAAKSNDSIRFAEHNSAFHLAILEAAGNVVLLDMWTTLNVKVRTFLNVSRQKYDLNEVAKSHQIILDAIESGSPAKARAASEAHVLGNKPL